MWCHLLFVVPLVIAALFFLLPWTTALPIALLLGIGTAAIGYYSAQALRQPIITGKGALTGRVGEAVSDLDPDGLVRIGSELWVAETSDRIDKGAPVKIVEVQGAKVKVRPWSS